MKLRVLKALPPEGQIKINDKVADLVMRSKDRERVFATLEEELYAQLRPGEEFRLVHPFKTKSKILRLGDTFFDDDGVEIMPVTVDGGETPTGVKLSNRLRFFTLAPMKDCLKDPSIRIAQLVIEPNGPPKIDGVCVGFDVKTRTIMVQGHGKNGKLWKEDAEPYWGSIMQESVIEDEEDREERPSRSSNKMEKRSTKRAALASI